MVYYYKLFDLLEKRGIRLSTFRNFLTNKTVAKLRKNEYLNTRTIAKICLYLRCQPGDIMEVYENET